MKPNSTLAERRRRDRDRKLRERALLAAQGIRPRQVWASDEAWAEVQPWLHALGVSHLGDAVGKHQRAKNRNGNANFSES